MRVIGRSKLLSWSVGVYDTSSRIGVYDNGSPSPSVDQTPWKMFGISSYWEAFSPVQTRVPMLNQWNTGDESRSGPELNVNLKSTEG